MQMRHPDTKLQAVYITEDNAFPQVTEFVQKSIVRLVDWLWITDICTDMNCKYEYLLILSVVSVVHALCYSISSLSSQLIQYCIKRCLLSQHKAVEPSANTSKYLFFTRVSDMILTAKCCLDPWNQHSSHFWRRDPKLRLSSWGHVGMILILVWAMEVGGMIKVRPRGYSSGVFESYVKGAKHWKKYEVKGPTGLVYLKYILNWLIHWLNVVPAKSM